MFFCFPPCNIITRSGQQEHHAINTRVACLCISWQAKKDDLEQLQRNNLACTDSERTNLGTYTFNTLASSSVCFPFSIFEISLDLRSGKCSVPFRHRHGRSSKSNSRSWFLNEVYVSQNGKWETKCCIPFASVGRWKPWNEREEVSSCRRKWVDCPHQFQVVSAHRNVPFKRASGNVQATVQSMYT